MRVLCLLQRYLVGRVLLSLLCLLTTKCMPLKQRIFCGSAQHVLWYAWPRESADPIALNPIRHALHAARATQTSTWVPCISSRCFFTSSGDVSDYEYQVDFFVISGLACGFFMCCSQLHKGTSKHADMHLFKKAYVCQQSTPHRGHVSHLAAACT